MVRAARELGQRVVLFSIDPGNRHPGISPTGRLSVDQLKRLREDERGWANSVRRYLNDPGLAAAARAALGLHVARAKGEALRAHRAEQYGAGEDQRPPRLRLSRSS